MIIYGGDKLFPILICEDDQYQLSIIEDYIEECICEANLDFKIVQSTQNSMDIVDYLESMHVTQSVFFLDFELRNQAYDGLKLARLIRRASYSNYIIFITSYADVAALTFEYDLNCTDFVLKDRLEQLKNRIGKSLLKIHQDIIVNKNKSFVFEYNQQIIDASQIYYIETSVKPHRIVINYKKELLDFRGTISEILKKLPSNFFQCHRSIIVNLDKVHYIDMNNRTIHLIDKRICDGSVSMLKKLRKTDIRYFAK